MTTLVSTEGTKSTHYPSDGRVAELGPSRLPGGGRSEPWDSQAGAVLAVKSMIISGLKDKLG